MRTKKFVVEDHNDILSKRDINILHKKGLIIEFRPFLLDNSASGRHNEI